MTILTLLVALSFALNAGSASTRRLLAASGALSSQATGVSHGGFVSSDLSATFQDSGISNLANVSMSSAAWGDCDNDLDPDILITGDTITGRISKIYRNNGNGTFTESNAGLPDGLPGVRNGSVAWGDYNNDGKLDFLLTGDTTTGPVTRLYKNTGRCTFSYITTTLPAISNSAVAWGDYNNDGRLDLLLTGDTGSGSVASVYRNNGNDTFTKVSDLLGAGKGVSNGAVAWKDYDGDSDLDILITGDSTAAGPVAAIY